MWLLIHVGIGVTGVSVFRMFTTPAGDYHLACSSGVLENNSVIPRAGTMISNIFSYKLFEKWFDGYCAELLGGSDAISWNFQRRCLYFRLCALYKLCTIVCMLPGYAINKGVEQCIGVYIYIWYSLTWNFALIKRQMVNILFIKPPLTLWKRECDDYCDRKSSWSLR